MTPQEKLAQEVLDKVIAFIAAKSDGAKSELTRSEFNLNYGMEHWVASFKTPAGDTICLQVIHEVKS